MTFNNPVFGGDVLVRPSIKSPNFITGVSGWSINRDGSAEFLDLFARATILLGSDPGAHVLLDSDGFIQVFDASNVQTMEIDPDGVLSMFGADGTIVSIAANSAINPKITFLPTEIGHTFTPGEIQANEQPQLILKSPAIDGLAIGELRVVGDNGTDGPRIVIENGDLEMFGQVISDIVVNDQPGLTADVRIIGAGDYKIRGDSMPRGAIPPLTQAAASTVVISATTGTFTTILSDAADRAVFAGRSYEVDFWNNGSIVSGGTGNAVGDRWNGKLQFSTNSGGAWSDLTSQKTIYRAAVAAAQRFELPLHRGIYKPGADSTTTRFRLQIAKTIGAGTVTSQAEGDHWLEVTDKGDAI